MLASNLLEASGERWAKERSFGRCRWYFASFRCMCVFVRACTVVFASVLGVLIPAARMVFNPTTSIWNRELNRMRQTASSIAPAGGGGGGAVAAAATAAAAAELLLVLLPAPYYD